MLPALLIMVREGFEAALVVAILYAYIRRIERTDLGRAVWAGVASAALIALTASIAIHIVLGRLEGDARLVSFGIVSLAAVGVLTWMVFWMRRQSRLIKNELQTKVDVALGTAHVGRAVAAVAFFAVLREGIEAGLFLVAATTADDGGRVAAGGAIGLAIAVALGYVVYAGGRRLPMQLFFRVTGIIIIVFAAGLMTRSVMFFQSADVLGTVADNIYDVRQYAWLTTSTEVGKFLSAMVGWDPRPSLEQVLAWALYLVPVTWLFLRPAGSPVPQPAAEVRTPEASASRA
jgi:high-affinity iron transporter